MASETPILHPTDWRVVPLGNLCSKIGSGATPKGGEESYLSSRSRFALVRSQNVLDRHFDTDGLAFISDEQAERLGGGRIHERDLLLNLTGDGVTFGRCCMVPKEILPACVNQHVAIVRIDPRRADPGYVLAYLTHPQVKVYIESFNAGGSRRAITKGHIESFQVPLPGLAEQRAISRILGTLDDKIESNRRMNATLEKIAKSRFSAWRDEQPGEVESTLVQELIDRRAILIGDGYRAKLSELGDGGLPFIRAGNLQEHGFVFNGCDILSSASVAAAGHKVSQPNDIAFTSKGTVGRIARVTSQTRRFVYSPQICFWRVLDPGQLHPNVLYRWMASDEFMHQVVAVKGQTDMAEYVSLKDQRRMTVNLPTPAAQMSIGEWLRSIDDRVAASHEQNQILTTIRDALLPKLISGEVRTRDGVRTT